MSSAEQLDEMGPIDYVVLEWPGRQPSGEVAPLLVDLVDKGIIRILDIAFMVKDEDGTVAAIDLAAVADGESAGFSEFEGASTGLLGDEDLQEAAAALEPGTSAAVLVWENRWAAPVAVALRKSGGQLVASGRLPVQAILASLDALEARTERSRFMPGLLRGVARTAVIAGTATSVSNRVSRRQANRWAQQEPAAYEEQPQQQYAPPPPAAAPAPDPIEQLKQLGALHEQGILTDEEFSAQKAKILG